MPLFTWIAIFGDYLASIVTALTSLLERHIWIYAERKHLFSAFDPITKTPPLRAIGVNEQREPTVR